MTENVILYLLDTSSLVDLSKRREPERTRIQALLDSEHVVGVCPIIVTEFFTGLPTEDRAEWEAFLATLAYWDITADMARRAGVYRYSFARAGQTISLPDALIAAVAAGMGATVVTRNVRDFPMSDVTVLDIGA